VKAFQHPLVGTLDLDFYVLHVPDSSGQRLLTHTAAPGSPSAAALELLALEGQARPPT
jgi:hypothetical protein